MAEPRFVDHEVDVVLNVTTTAEDVRAALARSGVVEGALIGEAMVERVRVAEFPEGDPAVVLPPGPLAGPQVGSNGPSGSSTSPSGRAAPEPQDCWCGEAQAGLCPTPEACGDDETVAQIRGYADHLIAYAASYGPHENLSDAQRHTRRQIAECGAILAAILDGEEWALRDN